jgi:poly(rC)-binding protein 3/4
MFFALFKQYLFDLKILTKNQHKISEAKITITEPRPEATETVIIISGTPEQTHAAQSLIQAFVICGPDTP